MRNIPTKSRKALASKVEDICRKKNLPTKALAEDASCNVRTVRNFFNGKSVKEATIRKICTAVGVDFDSAVRIEKGTTHSSDLKHGAYSETLVHDYVGFFYAYRRSFSVSGNFVRSLFKFAWDKTNNCLRFEESQTYHSPRLRRRVSYDQTGEVFISNTIGLIHLLTMERGALRLITLTRLHHDENFMRGVVLTQAEWPDHFQPSISPIYFRKITDPTTAEELIRHVGPIEAGDQDYTDIKGNLEQVETDVVRFAR